MVCTVPYLSAQLKKRKECKECERSNERDGVRKGAKDSNE